jgi:ATPase subunit of ABC transporter with duplicated ATPase domains
MPDHGDVILRFNKVSHKYNENKPILEEADFAIRERAKLTLMGQNGAGKTTIFKLITNEIQPEEGSLTLRGGATVGIAKQVIPVEDRDKTVLEFFASAFPKKIYNIEPKIQEILEVVHLHAPITRKVREFSGGQQARLLLAFALIQSPDILLLDGRLTI